MPSRTHITILNPIAKQLSNELAKCIPTLHTLASAMPTICPLNISSGKVPDTLLNPALLSPTQTAHNPATGYSHLTQLHHLWPCSSNLPEKQFPEHLLTNFSPHRCTLDPHTHHFYYSNPAYLHLLVLSLLSLLSASPPITLFPAFY